MALFLLPPPERIRAITPLSSKKDGKVMTFSSLMPLDKI